MIARRHPITQLAACAVAACATPACGEARGMTDCGTAAQVAPPPRPGDCRQLGPGAAIQPALDDPTVRAICLGAGDYQGPLRMTRPVILWGPPEAVLHSTAGTIVDVTGAGGAVLGLTIDGTGGRFDMLDGAVRLTADDTRVEGVTVVNAVFGILVERASHVRLIGNHIAGSRDLATGLRGDTIRLWETRDSAISNNVIEDGRDLVIWYSSGNTITGNHVRGARYGLHFMYSHDNEIRGNSLVDVTVGVFVMYSHGLHITDNVIANASGSAGMAIGLKDAGNIFLTGNELVRNTIGLYVDSSSMQRGERIEVAGNVLRLNDTAIVFHASSILAVRDNDLADNGEQVRIDGGGDALGVAWRGNYFDDYAGYDLDGDAIGDVAYEARSLSNQLTATSPNLALFHGTAALALVDAASHLDPLYAPRPLFVDHAPRMEPRWSTGDLERTTP